MAKTNPIGVRFDENLLLQLTVSDLAVTPQKALILYEKSYIELLELKIKMNNKPENKKRIEEERQSTISHSWTTPAGLDEMAKPDNEAIQKQIEALIKERDNPPKEHSVIGKKVWRNDRQKKIDELQKQIKQIN